MHVFNSNGDLTLCFSRRSIKRRWRKPECRNSSTVLPGQSYLAKCRSSCHGRSNKLGGSNNWKRISVSCFECVCPSNGAHNSGKFLQSRSMLASYRRYTGPCFTAPSFNASGLRQNHSPWERESDRRRISFTAATLRQRHILFNAASSKSAHKLTQDNNKTEFV